MAAMALYRGEKSRQDRRKICIYYSLQRLFFLIELPVPSWMPVDALDAKRTKKADEGKNEKRTLGNEAKIGNDVTRCWRLIQIKLCLRQEVFVTLAKIF